MHTLYHLDGHLLEVIYYGYLKQVPLNVASGYHQLITADGLYIIH